MRFVWSDEFSVKVQIIDDQHKEYFRIANRLDELIESGVKEGLQEHLLSVLARLGNYALYHFSTEEEALNLGCPEADKHIAQHDDFRARMRGYLDEVRKEDANVPELAMEINVYAINWLTAHILTTDANSAECFRSAGLE